MKKLLLLTILLSILISCNGRKQVEKAVNSGNYDQAITNALKKLETNKTKKRKQDYVLMLRDAYYKAIERDLNTINHLQKDNNPELYTEIHELFLDLDARQEAIKPVMPLLVNGKAIKFKFNDYSNDIIKSRNDAADYLYEKGLALLETDNKAKMRQAYDIYNYIERIYPNYEDSRELMDEAHQRGISYVIVSIENQTQQIIPQQLEDDLLNFDTYGLNQFWTTYHAIADANINYDFAMQLQLQRINISPERIKGQQLIREKEVVDGWEYELDHDGNVAKDTLGNDIKIDKIITVKARYNEFVQTKSSQVIANVVYTNLVSNQILDAFPIDSGFIFENVFARYRGDKRALTREDLDIARNRQVPFPSNEQMVYDTGEDLKLKLKNIINSYSFNY